MRARLGASVFLMSVLLVSVVSRGGTSEAPLVAHELHERAVARGTVRVLVRLDTAFVPEHALAAPAHVALQRQGIAAAQARVRAQLQGLQHRVVRDYGSRLPVMAMEVSPDALRALGTLRGVVAQVHEDRAHRPSLPQSVPLIRASNVWSAGFDGTGQIVAILDTGVQRDHPFFVQGGTSKVIAEACFSTNLASDSATSLCPGQVSEAIGIGTATPCLFRDAAANCPTAIDGWFHGTHVAGIAAGDGRGVAGAPPGGVARGAKIIAVQVFSRIDDPLACSPASTCALSYSSDQLAALDWIQTQRTNPAFGSLRIASVNISLGGGPQATDCDGDPLKPAIDALLTANPNDATDAGVATAIAAGNDGATDGVDNPACITSAVQVASSTKSNAVSGFTNVGDPLVFPNELFAPGSSITSALPPQAGLGVFGILSGTSMATPHVAGAFAVLRQISPTATVDALVNRLTTTGPLIHDVLHTVPRIDVLAAAPPNLGVSTLTAPAAAVPGANISVTAAIKNTLGLAAASRLDLYLSTDSTITTADTLLGSIAFGQLLAGTPSAPQTSATQTKTVQIPLATLPGNYFIGAIADGGAQLAETNESDNTKAVPIQVALADLTVPSVTFTPAATAPGANVSVTHTLRNMAPSPANAPGSVSGIYLATGQSLGTALGRLATVNAPAVAAGATSAAITATNVNIPGGTPPGHYFFLVQANDDGALAELTGGNDVGASATSIIVGPDLTVSLATIGSVATGGTNASVSYTVQNKGGQVANNFTVGFALVPINDLSGASDIAIGPSKPVVSVPGGASVALTSTVVIPNGISPGLYRVRVIADVGNVVVEADETNNSLLTTNTLNATAGTMQFSAATYVTSEPQSGASVATITVTRTGTVTAPGLLAGGVLVDFATSDGTARAGQNYTATTGTLTFNGANASATFSVPILADGQAEGDNTVLLSLSNPRALNTGPGAAAPVLGTLKSAVLTIKDFQKGLQFSSSNYSVAETAAAVTVSVIRTGPTTDTATVRYSTSDGTAVASVNYAATSGVLTFAPGVSSQSFAVKILPDKVVDGGGSRTFLVLLSNANASAAPPIALGPRSSAVVRIGDVDVGGTVQLASPTFSVGEAAGAAVITISRTGGTAGAVTVDYTTCDQTTIPVCPGSAKAGTDYQPTAGTVTFGPSETTKTIQVPVTNDLVVNGNRAFGFQLGNVQGGATLGTPSFATVTIVDDDQAGTLQLTASTYTVVEPASGNTSVTLTVTRTGTNLASGASVVLLTGNGTAEPGINYIPLATTLVFDTNQTSQSVPLTVFADPMPATPTGNLTVPLTLVSPGGGASLGTPKSGVVNIIDSARSVQFSAPNYSVTEGGTVTVTVVRGGSTTGTATVHWAATGGNPGVDYTPASGNLTFASGVTTMSFPITTKDNGIAGPDLQVTLALSGPSNTALGPQATAALTIRDNDGPGVFQFSSPSYSVAEGGAATITVGRTGGSCGTAALPVPGCGPVTLQWNASGGNAGDFTLPASRTLTFAAGVVSQTFSLTTVNNTIVDGNRPVTLTLGAPSNGTLGAGNTSTLTIIDNDNGGTIQFASASQSAVENAGTVNLVVSRTGTALSSGVLVDYTLTGDTGSVGSLLAGTLTFATAGQTSATIPVTIVNNPAPQVDRTVVVTLSNPRPAPPLGVDGPNGPVLGAVTSTTLTITDSQPRVQFSTPNFAVTEGKTATITLTRAVSTAGSTTVNYTIAGDTGFVTSGLSGSVTFPAGSTSATFPVGTSDDGVLNGNHVVTLTLSSATASVAGTNPATLTILDNQSAGTLQFATATASVVEGGTVHLTVTRSGNNLIDGVTVNWSATGGTATAGVNFSPSSGTLTFGAGVASQSFDIAAVDDGVAEGSQTIVLSLDTPTGGAALGTPSAMTVFIVDAEQSVAFSTAGYTIGETTAQAAITVVRFGVPTGPVTVTATTVPAPVDPSLQAQPGLDYTSVNTTLTFGPGEIAKTFNVPIITGNALTRNGKRFVGLQLGAPSNTALGTPSAAMLEITDFRPDLVITSVAPPSNTLTGKAVSAPSAVRNIGQAAAPAFRIGLFMALDDGTDASKVPGAGTLVATQTVASLAAGASATFPTQITLDDEFPPGDYYVSAVANFGQTISEADFTNDGLSSSPQKMTVSRNLTNFKSANASFSQTSPPPPGSPSTASIASVSCDVTGSVNLTGTFSISSQSRDVATGQANLTGTISGTPVQYLISFTGQGDNSGNVTAVLNSVVFNVLGTSLTGSGNGSFTGTLNGRTLSGNVSGQFTTSTGGACVFTGTLTAQGQTSFEFRFGTQVNLGSFGFATTPTLTPGASPQGYVPAFRVFFDSPFADPATVLFTGPTGSGYGNAPADSSNSHENGSGDKFTYIASPHSGNAPGGTWSVSYKGLTHPFTVPPFNPGSSYVVIFPTVTLDTSQGTPLLTRIDWVYQDPITGVTLPAAPAFVAGVSVAVQLQDGGNSQPESPTLSPSTTTFDLVAAGFSPPEWTQVQGISFQYNDIVGNGYELGYDKTLAIQVNPRLENVYSASTPTGSRERLLNIFVDVPSGSVDTTPCSSQGSGPFIVSVQNQTQVGAPPYGNPTCIDKTGTTNFSNGSGLTDIFSLRTNLNSGPDAVLPGPLQVGTQFLFNIAPLSLPTQTFVTSLEIPEANPSTDFISIPGSAGLKPAGFTLTAARLGQSQTISWTRPAFAVRDLFINPIVNTGINGGGVFCSVQTGNLDPAATQATFTLPTTCKDQSNIDQPVQSASVCIFYEGVDGQTSDACWFWQ